MKKKGYKQMQKRLLRETKKAFLAEQEKKLEHNRREEADEEAKYYRERLLKFGSNVKTVEPSKGKYVECIKWELEPQQWGQYAVTGQDVDVLKVLPEIKERVVKSIAKSLIERNIVQFVLKCNEEYDPFNEYGTVGAKLYVVPWEQMPHERTIELMQYAEKLWQE